MALFCHRFNLWNKKKVIWFDNLMFGRLFICFLSRWLDKPRSPMMCCACVLNHYTRSDCRTCANSLLVNGHTNEIRVQNESTRVCFAIFFIAPTTQTQLTAVRVYCTMIASKQINVLNEFEWIFTRMNAMTSTPWNLYLDCICVWFNNRVQHM